MSLTDDVKERALAMGADLIGVAPVDRFESAPNTGKPQYYMHDAKSVIVIATRILQGMCDVFGSFEEEGKTIGPYLWSYSQINWANSWIAIQIGRLLENHGYKAIPFPPTGINYRNGDKNPSIPDFYNKHAAIAAGLGEFGLSSLLLTPEFGPRQRLIPIVTNAPLAPDPMYNGPKLCRPELCKKFCVRMCPEDAIEDTIRIIKIGDREFEHATVKSHRCLFQTVGGKYTRSKAYFTKPVEDEQIMELIKDGSQHMTHPADRSLHAFTFGPTCGRCLVKCPAPWK